MKTFINECGEKVTFMIAITVLFNTSFVLSF